MISGHAIRPIINALGGLILIGGAALAGGGGLAWLLPQTPAPTAMPAPDITLPPEPESTTPRRVQAPVVAKDYLIVAAHPAAAQSGAAILDAGGSAIDGLIAAQMMLNLVEPQSSGIGGGGFLLYWDAKTRTLTSYDGRETAPLSPPVAGADSLFRGPDGSPKEFVDAMAGGLSVGTPGLLRMLEMAHVAHGTRPWHSLFAAAAARADAGFPVSPRLHRLLTNAPHLRQFPAARAYFYDAGGAPRPIGYRLRNPDFATTLRLIAEGGADAFYTGLTAEAIVAAVRAAPVNPGRLGMKDLRDYRAKVRPNLCALYREYRVCGMPPPSSGGIALLQILGLLAAIESDADADTPAGPGNAAHPDRVQDFAEAMKLAFADRARYLGDSDFVPVPVEGLLAPDYLANRAAMMDRGRDGKTPAAPGRPADAPEATHAEPATGVAEEPPSTTHLSVVDRAGNIAVMTSSIEFGFGSGLMAAGFLLNNQLTDFAWPFREGSGMDSGANSGSGSALPNRFEPGKRPLSSMSPTLVFDADGAPRLALGSPGGSRIIGYVAKSLIGVLDHDLSLQAAIDLPHYLNRNGPLELEESPDAARLADAMTARGYTVTVQPMSSGLHGIAFMHGHYVAGVDPRREGAAVGEHQLNPDGDAGFAFINP